MLTEICETFDAWSEFGEPTVKMKVDASVMLFVLGDIDSPLFELRLQLIGFQEGFIC